MSALRLKAGSLFSGVGGIDRGLEAAGFDVRWQVEIDGAARSVLKRHFPDVHRHHDVREVGLEQLEPVDLVCGGFPCQDLSVAGRRAGLGGERSGLWWEFHRILSELRPRWCFIENVPGLLSSNGGRDMGTVLWSLGQLGYGYAYRVLDARFFGLAQRRRRVLIVGCLGDGRRAAEVLLEPEGLLGDLAAGRAPRADVAGTLGSQPAGSGFRADLDRSGAFIVNAAESCARASHARPADVARALDTTGGFSANQGGTVVAAYDASGLAEQARTLLSPRPGGGGSLVADTVRASSGKSTSSNAQLVEVVAFDERNVTSPDNRSNPQPGAPCHTLNGDAPLIAGTLRHSGKGAGSATQQDAQAGLIVAATLTSGGNPNSNAPGRRHEDDENPVAQTFDWQVAGSNRTWIHDKPDGPVRALTAQKTMAVAFQCHGSNVGPLGALRQGNGNETGGVPFLDARVGVRRLTPLECARLQGFPDWWLDGLGLSDAAKYRQLGNAMPPPMAYWVAARVVALERRLAVAEPESASA